MVLVNPVQREDCFFLLCVLSRGIIREKQGSFRRGKELARPPSLRVSLGILLLECGNYAMMPG